MEVAWLLHSIIMPDAGKIEGRGLSFSAGSTADRPMADRNACKKRPETALFRGADARGA